MLKVCNFYVLEIKWGYIIVPSYSLRPTSVEEPDLPVLDLGSAFPWIRSGSTLDLARICFRIENAKDPLEDALGFSWPSGQIVGGSSKNIT